MGSSPVAPSSILVRARTRASSDRLNIAAVGIGGMGHTNINHVEGYGKYRRFVMGPVPHKGKVCSMSFPMRSIGTIKMYDEMGKATSMLLSSLLPIYTHYATATGWMPATWQTVYCQKPPTHSAYESCLLDPAWPLLRE